MVGVSARLEKAGRKDRVAQMNLDWDDMPARTAEELCRMAKVNPALAQHPFMALKRETRERLEEAATAGLECPNCRRQLSQGECVDGIALFCTYPCGSTIANTGRSGKTIWEAWAALAEDIDQEAVEKENAGL